MIQEIHSRENRIYKQFLRLLQKKYRDREDLYLIEGCNLIEEAPEKQLVYAALDCSLTGSQCLDRLIRRIGEKRICLMDSALFSRIAQTETSQGIVAIMKKPRYTQADLKRRLGSGKNLIVLDRLQDPGNIGTIIRTCEGAGYGAVVTLKGTGDVYAPKTVRAAAGSVFRIPVIQVEDCRELKKLADSLGKRLTVTCFDTDNYYFDTDLSADTALIIGNEGSGISEELMAMADIKVKIPMEGRLESLNASVAAGILMYEAQRARRKQNI